MGRSRSLAQLALAVASLYVALPAFAQDADRCSEILRPELMTVIKSDQSEAFRDAFVAWQCSFQFSSHDEAMHAGLSVGTEVFGVPLQVGGTFDKSQVDAWKNENCSSSKRNTDYKVATSYFLTQIAPGVVDAWTQCMANSWLPTAVRCELSGMPPTFNARWFKTDGEPDTSAPVVTNFTVKNGSCDPVLPAGLHIGSGGVVSACTPDRRKTMVVLLNTTRGMCLPATTTYAQRVESVDGVKRLDHDTTIDADIVEFKPGASIITNGYYLAITANELRLSGDADIVSFEPRSPRPAGDDGRSGGSIIIQADEITGKRLKIDDHGEDGAKGSKGTQGSSGGKGTHGVGRHLDAFRGCIGSRLAGRGGVGGNGGPGGPGGNGGNGGTVTIRVGTGLTNGAVTRIAVVMQADDRTLAGHGGQRGDGGDAGPGGPGGDGAEGKHPCGGVPGGPSGPSGNRGPDGVDGRDGQGGAVVISR